MEVGDAFPRRREFLNQRLESEGNALKASGYVLVQTKLKNNGLI
jgi:hypothetical protein